MLNTKFHANISNSDRVIAIKVNNKMSVKENLSPMLFLVSMPNFVPVGNSDQVAACKPTFKMAATSIFELGFCVSEI